MIPDETLRRMVDELTDVRGVVGVVLGGSRARGDALPTSDVDLGVYYEGTPDTAGLSRLASRWSGRDVMVGEPGSWGQWVDAGGWLEVDGTAVDWILRDVDRVAAQADRASRGEFAFHAQAGHPLGFLDVAYAGELATGVVLADPAGRLASLRTAVTAYPRSPCATRWSAPSGRPTSCSARPGRVPEQRTRRTCRWRSRGRSCCARTRSMPTPVGG